MVVNDFMMIILKAVISIVVACVGFYVIPFIKAKLVGEKTTAILNYVQEFVQAAEQIYGEKTGQTKKEFVMNLVKNVAKQIKITITDEQISALIESAVYNMNYFKEDEVKVDEKTGDVI